MKKIPNDNLLGGELRETIKNYALKTKIINSKDNPLIDKNYPLFHITYKEKTQFKFL